MFTSGSIKNPIKATQLQYYCHAGKQARVKSKKEVNCVFLSRSHRYAKKIYLNHVKLHQKPNVKGIINPERGFMPQTHTHQQKAYLHKHICK